MPALEIISCTKLLPSYKTQGRDARKKPVMLGRGKKALLKSQLPQEGMKSICQQRSKCFFEIGAESQEEKGRLSQQSK